MRIIPIEKSNLQYLATLLEDCEITAMCEWNGLLYLATDKNKLWAFDVNTLEFTEIKVTDATK